MNAAAPTKPANKLSNPRERGIVIREPKLQKQQEQQAEAEALDESEDPEYKRKGKKIKKAYVDPSRGFTPLPLRKAKKETTENMLKEEAWLQRQRNMAIGVGAFELQSSYISQEVEQHCVVIEEVNSSLEIRSVVLPSELLREQPAAETSNSPLVPLNPKRPMVEIGELAPRTTKLERTLTLVTHPIVAAVVSKPKTAPPITPMPIQASTTISQDIAATPTTIITLLLLTSGPQFDKTATSTCSKLVKSSASQSHHTEKLPSGAPSNA